MVKQEQEDQPKKNLTFKTIHHIKNDDNDNYNNNDDEEDHEGIKQGIALITKKFQSFLRKKQGNKIFSNFKKMGTRKIQAGNF